jgi:hypothetical protein
MRVLIAEAEKPTGTSLSMNCGRAETDVVRGSQHPDSARLHPSPPIASSIDYELDPVRHLLRLMQ